MLRELNATFPTSKLSLLAGVWYSGDVNWRPIVGFANINVIKWTCILTLFSAVSLLDGLTCLLVCSCCVQGGLFHSRCGESGWLFCVLQPRPSAQRTSYRAGSEIHPAPTCTLDTHGGECVTGTSRRDGRFLFLLVFVRDVCP